MKELNEHYTRNAPDMIIDDEGIFHFREIPMPDVYQKNPCSCGLTHKNDLPSWYHSCLKMIQDPDAPQKVVKKCKGCHDILLLKRVIL